MEMNENKYCDEKSTLYVLTLAYFKLVNII